MNISKSNNSGFIFLAAVFILLYIVLYFFRATNLIVDEVDSFQQIINFSNLNFELLEISAMPGYHAIMATFVWCTGLDSIFYLRAVTLFLGFLTVCTFYFILDYLNTPHVIIRTIQFFTLPMIFVYLFLIYTDILSLLFILLMVLFSSRKQFVLAGLFGILSMLIRQNNVIWMAMIPAMFYFEQYGLKINAKNLQVTIKKMWTYVLGIALFILFVIVNKGVAIGDSSSHPAFKFSTGNLFFFLFCIFLFFLPFQIYYIRKVLKLIYNNRVVWILFFLFFVFYWFTFNPDHPYNALAPHYFLRNLLLTRIAGSEFLKLLFFVPVLYAGCTLYYIILRKRTDYLLYLFTFLFLIPSWLIEQRYYIIPITLLLIYREPLSKKMELVQVVYNIVLLLLLMPLILDGKAFL